MSYTPLKTINGQSIKGTGNLTVTGGGIIKITTTSVANGTWTVQGFRIYGII